MSDNIGKNTPNADLLRSFIDRLENIDAQKKALAEDRKLIVAELKAAGFNYNQGVLPILRERKMKPHARQDAIMVRDIYMHAMEMDAEPPLFRQLEIFARDNAAADKLLDAFKKLVPPGGEIITVIGGKRMRLWRDREGVPHSEDYNPPAPAQHQAAIGIPPRPRKEVPACSVDEAVALGETAAKENVPVIENPFPYGDERRARWDEGWRKGSGNDGMGGQNP